MQSQGISINLHIKKLGLVPLLISQSVPAAPWATLFLVLGSCSETDVSWDMEGTPREADRGMGDKKGDTVGGISGRANDHWEEGGRCTAESRAPIWEGKGSLVPTVSTPLSMDEGCSL